MSGLARERDVAIAAVREAGLLCRAVRASFDDRLRADKATERPMRIDVERAATLADGSALLSWMERHPLENRLTHGPANPIDLGWLLLEA